jgi:hypothetical protein
VFGFTPRGSYAGEGDGNGIIEGVIWDGPNSNYGLNTFAGETAVFWVDLSQANLIDGGFSVAAAYMLSTTVSVTTDQVSNYFPAAKLGRGNYFYVYSGGWNELRSNNVLDGDGKNYFGLSAIIGSNPVGFPISNTSIPVIQAFNIDTKLDDGLPQSGKVMALYDYGGVGYWAAGGSPSAAGQMIPGAYDTNNFGPVTTSDNIATPPTANTCYDNGNIPNTLEHYTTSINGGSGPNCALSFQFQ